MREVTLERTDTDLPQQEKYAVKGVLLCLVAIFAAGAVYGWLKHGRSDAPVFSDGLRCSGSRVESAVMCGVLAAAAAAIAAFVVAASTAVAYIIFVW